MTTYDRTLTFQTISCCNCGQPFGMSEAVYKRRKNDRQTFYCPEGHPQHFTGPSEADKLRDELERQKQMREAAEQRAVSAMDARDQIKKAHRKMRARVMNGVCPCCTRTFQNLLRHMQTEHPEFTKEQGLGQLRSIFGMTQAAVAEEAGVQGNHVSLYERGKPVAHYAKAALDAWMERHQGAAA